MADFGLPHIVLVGLPGAGKSTAGPLAAERLGVEFLDFDREIERSTGLSVSAIFRELGEKEFRRLETALTAHLSEAPPMLLAPGGGWIANASNRALLGHRSRIVYLAVSVPVALRRLGATVASRPLLSGSDPEGALHALFEDRRRYYEAADATLDTELLGVDGVVTSITELARRWGWPVR
jgi:shikimate kinase